jgi:hypothetical protein
MKNHCHCDDISRQHKIARFEAMYQALLFTSGSSAPLHQALSQVFIRHFDAFSQASENEEPQESTDFQDFCIQLHKLNLLALSEEIFTEILFHQIEQRIQKTCKGNFDVSTLQPTIDWMRNVTLKWLQFVVCPNGMTL